ncbi:MAG: hypothetical protein AB4062_03155 [Crocosphaera sp.]
MDEPFGALDVHTRENIQQLILNIWESIECTILMISHDVREAVFLSQRIYILTPSPGLIKQELIIDLPKPRDDTIYHNPHFHHYVDQITALIRV